LLATLHVRGADGRWSVGGDAAIRIAAAVPLLAPLAIVARLPGARRAIDAAYRVTAAHRGQLSRLLGLDRCGLPLARASRVAKRGTGSR
jgi:predicted DCC family thiol-disulfide oxidoreductase YuxK